MRTRTMSEPDVPVRPETPYDAGAHPRLTDEQIMLLSTYGDKRLRFMASSGHF